MKFLFALALSAMTMPPVWASLFLGENMYTYRQEGNCMLTIHQHWKLDIKISREKDTLSTLSEQEIRQVNTALDEYMQAATEAHAALTNFAVYSMAPLRSTKPELYLNALTQYHRALDILFTKDMEQLRLNSILTSRNRTIHIHPEQDALSEALQQRISRNFDTFRNAWAEYHEHRSELHKQRVTFMLNLLAGDRPPCEFITNTPLETAPHDYTSNCAARFQAAYAAWQKYADCAVRMHCPAPSLQGNSTPDAKAAMQLILQNHFEQFLTRLTGGLGR